MLLEVHRKFLTRTSRVKSVDFHPTEPWLLLGLYNGSVQIYHTGTGTLVKSFELTNVPVRCVAFIARKNWFVAGSDDFQLRVFNYNTFEKVAGFEAHPDYIRCLTVHPTLSLVFTGSDDMTIKSWDWDKGWKNMMVYQGHTHYIMNIAVNPKDTNTFASSCLDRSIKLWSITASSANFTMAAHDKSPSGGVNYVSFHPNPNSVNPYLITTGDDKTIRIWDYQSKALIQTLEGHTSNVSFAFYHPNPNVPVIVSGSEDGTVRIWNAGTYRLENTLEFGLERAWCGAYERGVAGSGTGSNDVAVGFDEGIVLLKLGRDEPTYSMDSSGKVVYTRGNEVLSFNLQQLHQDELQQAQPSVLADGAKIPCSPRDLGSTELFATSLLHSPNGRFVTALGDGEYIIYTSLAWRNKAFGQGTSFAWAEDSNTYAVLENRVKIRVFKNFKEKTGAGVLKGVGGWAVEGLHGGTLLGARGSGFVLFWDWETGEVVRRVDVDAKTLYWSGSGTLVTIAADDSFYILRFDRNAYESALASGVDVGDEGIESAFEVVAEITESIKSAKWVGDCFIYVTAGNRLNYLVGSQPRTVAHFEAPLHLLGYIPAHGKIYLADKHMALYGYSLSLSVVEYQTAVLRGDTEAAERILNGDGETTGLSAEERTKVARFLEEQGQKSQALALTTDSEHKFELAVQLEDLPTALAILESLPAGPENEAKWKSIGDKALATWKFSLAQRCFEQAGDVHGMFLVALAFGDKKKVRQVASLASGKGLNNIAFAALWQAGDAKAAADLLIKTDRAPEAAFLARTYVPSTVPKAVQAWKTTLESKNKPKIAQSLADPSRGEEESSLFEEGWEEALEREEALLAKQQTGLDTLDGLALA